MHVNSTLNIIFNHYFGSSVHPTDPLKSGHQHVLSLKLKDRIEECLLSRKVQGETW